MITQQYVSNTRNKRAVSWCGGSDDKLNKSAAHLAPLGETHVRTSVFGNEPVFNKSSPTICKRVFMLLVKSVF